MGEENTFITHPGSEELEENGLSVSLGSEVIRGELKSRGGGCRKGKEEGSLFHHCCFELLFCDCVDVVLESGKYFLDLALRRGSCLAW